MWGLSGWGIRGEGQACVAIRYLTPYFGYIILPHVDWPAQCLAQRKSQKKYTKRKDRNRYETKTFLLYFPLFSGFNNHSVDEGFFPKYIEMVESPSLRCQKYINSFHVCMCPHLVFRASIRVSFLLEVLSKSCKS